MSERLSLTRELTEELCARVDRSPLPEADRTILKACVRYCFALGEAYAEKTTTIHKLLKMIFGAKTEKAEKILPEFTREPKKEKSSKPKGHGRLGAAPAMAGEDPYIGIVGVDNAAAVPFYYSPKHTQFLFNTVDVFGIPQVFGSFPPVNQYTRVGGTGDEQFRSQTLNNQAEVCDTTGTGVAPNFVTRGLKTAVTPAGNAGFYEWYIRLPKKPSSEINVVVECGVLKPNAFAAYRFGAIELCAAETGERVGFGTCVRQEVDPGVSPVVQAALPKITAIVYPGPYNVSFSPFHLTAWKNPSAYTLAFDGVTFAMSNNTNSQVLDGSSNARILLKACMDKTIVNKLPVTGQINALGETENDLEAGDLIYVRMDVPRQGTTDVYCHAQSVRLAGVGESPF